MEQEQATQAVGDYLTHHRYDPPERDGWFSMYEIQKGLRNDIGFSIRGLHFVRAMDTLMASQPPQAEDIWMMSHNDGNPNLENQHRRPHQPDGSRRYYRILRTSVEYIDPS